MKTDSAKFAIGRWSSVLVLVFLASCGGGDDGSSAVGRAAPSGVSSGY